MNFTEQLIIFLIMLLFAKDLVVAYARKRGWVNGDNKKEIGELKNHASVANEEMGELNKKFDKLLEMGEKEIEQHGEMLYILRDIKDKIK